MKHFSWDSATHVHFIGIGGIGISAIARMCLHEGKHVSGSDQAQSLVVSELKKAGARITIGHHKRNVPTRCDLVIYTIAIGDANPELCVARRRGIKTFSYPQALGILSAHKYTVAVSGTHGKTTTTAMIASITRVARRNPTVIVGSFLLSGNRRKKTNFIAGKSDLFIVEACEYRRSFLNISPWVAVITNIDNDHLDYYKNTKDIERAFNEFLRRVPRDGFVICNPHDIHTRHALTGVRATIIDYTKRSAQGLTLAIPGAHNVFNAKAALCVADALGIKNTISIDALRSFNGTWRRFEYKGITTSGAHVYDDYAHHPTEIQASILSARETLRVLKTKGVLWIVFQPHLYSRTKLLLSDFAKALSCADRVLVVDIYAAREPKDSTIHSRDLVREINTHRKGIAEYVSHFSVARAILKKKTKKGDVVITMGAGDITTISNDLTKTTGT